MSPLIFTLGALVGSGLLFLIQPLVTKLFLPVLGGSPAVWSACAVFFQSALLAGYGYAHLLSRRLGARRQALIHTGLLLLAVAFLPTRLGARTLSPDGAHPVLWILLVLTRTLGPTLVLLCATGPLLQSWAAALGRPTPRSSPYTLYAASNLGSLAALVAYPTIVEPYLPVVASPSASTALSWFSQGVLWTCGYGLFVALMFGCAVAVARAPAATTHTAAPDDGLPRAAPTWRQRLMWCVLAFAPSSAMLGTAQALTTDVAAVPLLFIVPLALYLLTLVLAFWGRIHIPPRASFLAAAVLTMATCAMGWILPRQSPAIDIALHLASLTAWALCCHGRLADRRPAASQLTDYYLWIALGGALGGVFNGLLAPLLFTSVAEYPIVLTLAALLGPPRPARTASRERRALALDLLLPLAMAALVFGLHAAWKTDSADDILLRVRVEAALALGLALTTLGRPVRCAAALAVLFISSRALSLLGDGETLYAERTFFGTLRVKEVEGVSFIPQGGPHAGQVVRLPLRHLFHGTTMHGTQLPRAGLSLQPAGYYHRSGPIGNVFQMLEGTSLTDDVGFVGLGAGACAAYAKPGQRFSFYELDPAVIRIARNPAYFTYLRDSPGTVRTISGDGRLRLGLEPDGHFGLLVIDAFSSDAVPMHLLTREALALYLRKVQSGGVVAFHLSSEFFDLLPVVAEIANALGVPGLAWIDAAMTPEQIVTGKQPSRWAVIAAAPAALQRFASTPGWRPLPSFRRPGGDRHLLWTDLQASPFAALR